ncbi:MAG: ferredoxin--NADP reductase [Nevskiaceae bacterium]
MVALATERVLDVRHWNDSLFSFRTTRDAGLRFENGHFVMLGLPPEQHGGKSVMRAYSIASANYEDHLEFFSIKVHNGPLTSRLQHLKRGDDIIVSRKPTGTLLIHDLLPGRTLYLLSTGTGLAPFLSIIRDPQSYARFEKVVLVHGVRQVSDLAYHDYLAHSLPQHDYLGEFVRNQLIYYPTATREPFRYNGRLTELISSGKLFADIGLPSFTPDDDRAMVCGSPSMLADTRALLDSRGFVVSPNIGTPGHYVFERSFVER